MSASSCVDALTGLLASLLGIVMDKGPTLIYRFHGWLEVGLGNIRDTLSSFIGRSG